MKPTAAAQLCARLERLISARFNPADLVMQDRTEDPFYKAWYITGKWRGDGSEVHVDSYYTVEECLAHGIRRGPPHYFDDIGGYYRNGPMNHDWVTVEAHMEEDEW